jgi:hypothetical protein
MARRQKFRCWRCMAWSSPMEYDMLNAPLTDQQERFLCDYYTGQFFPCDLDAEPWVHRL